MLSDAHYIKLVRECFPDYSPMEVRADHRYWEALDPKFFLRIAVQFKLGPYLSDKHSSNELGVDLLEDNSEKFDATQRATFHYLRLLSSEALLLALCAAYPFGPALRIMQLSNRQQIKILTDVANGVVPDLHGSRKVSEEISFLEWFKYVLHSTGPIDKNLSNRQIYSPELLRELEGFIRGLAHSLIDRSSINAFKHGRLSAPIQGQVFQVHRDFSGNETTLLSDQEGGLSWSSWRESQIGGKIDQSLSIGFSATDTENDYEILKLNTSLLAMIKSFRSAPFKEESDIRFFAPDPVKVQTVIETMKLNLSLRFQQPGKVP